MGSTAGLERLDLLLPKLEPYVDCFMGTRGAIRTCLKPEYNQCNRIESYIWFQHGSG